MVEYTEILLSILSFSSELLLQLMPTCNSLQHNANANGFLTFWNKLEAQLSELENKGKRR